jgi:hypothetical protein
MFSNTVQALPKCKGTDSSKWTNCFGTKSIKADKKEPYVGIGIHIESKAGLIKLLSIMDNSPASKAGLKAGDYIIRIDGAEVNRKNLKDAVNMIRGAAGAPVEITIRRKGEKKVIVLKIVREIIQTKSTKTKGDYIYIGEYKDGKRHGQGTFTWADGTKYVGQYKDDKRHGQGTYTFADGRKYVGQYKDGKKHGEGTFTWADGDKYIGEFKDNKANGQGTFTFASGNKYVGEFKDGKRHGKGTLTFPHGGVYVGEFQNDKEHGRATYTRSSGEIWKGIWENGTLVKCNEGC